jgi:hypothetical protein
MFGRIIWGPHSLVFPGPLKGFPIAVPPLKIETSFTFTSSTFRFLTSVCVTVNEIGWTNGYVAEKMVPPSVLMLTTGASAVAELAIPRAAAKKENVTNLRIENLSKKDQLTWALGCPVDQSDIDSGANSGCLATAQR